MILKRKIQKFLNLFLCALKVCQYPLDVADLIFQLIPPGFFRFTSRALFHVNKFFQNSNKLLLPALLLLIAVFHCCYINEFTGIATGSLVGGFCISTFGARETFYWAGLISLSVGVLHWIVHLFKDCLCPNPCLKDSCIAKNES